jgi:ribonuclease P protein component
LVNPLARPDGSLRFGVTVTKKIGNAVMRNRMKRRFRALLRELLPVHGIAGADHVLIGRENGVERDFALLHGELVQALARAAAGKGDPPESRTGSAGQSLPPSRPTVAKRHEAPAHPHRTGLAAWPLPRAAPVLPLCPLVLAIRDRGVAEAWCD